MNLIITLLPLAWCRFTPHVERHGRSPPDNLDCRSSPEYGAAANDSRFVWRIIWRPFYWAASQLFCWGLQWKRHYFTGFLSMTRCRKLGSWCSCLEMARYRRTCTSLALNTLTVIRCQSIFGRERAWMNVLALKLAISGCHCHLLPISGAWPHPNRRALRAQGLWLF